MYYVTVMQPPKYRQITLEEFLFGGGQNSVIENGNANTRTYAVQEVPQRYIESTDVGALIEKLRMFNATFDHLRSEKRESLYRTFPIPKKSGGVRRISSPNDELMEALRILKRIFENDFKALYHTSSFAYVKKRCCLDAVKRHQENNSRWFAKFDFHDFFGSTTLDFAMRMFSMIFPFSEVVKDANGKEELYKALELGFLNGGLPQGTPLSPCITTIMMMPFDFELSKKLRDFDGQKYVYTRYADDIIISSRYDFDVNKIENVVLETLKSIDAPMVLNKKKTRYGSSSGSNWNLGVMLNSDNQITIGHSKKHQFRAMLSSFALDTINGTPWDIEDVRSLKGLMEYYKHVEGDTITEIVDSMSKKYSTDINALIKAALTI